MKKAIAIFLAVLVVITVAVAAVGCGQTGNNDVKIVFLGDSIGEAVLGPSPISEREYYGYYALVGRSNGYSYINRAVSGHQTKDFLAYLNREDDSATATLTHIRQADVIHVSILGNDMLQNGVGRLLIEAVMEKKAEAEGRSYEASYREGILAQSRINFAKIVARLKELNPDALLLFQSVYNPIYPETVMVSEADRARLLQLGCTPDQYREYGYYMISKLNGVAREYLETVDPDAFEIVDAYTRFDEIHRQDEMRGKALIYPDWVHPSNEGHAVMADLITRKLEEHGLADQKTAVKNYRELRLKQLDRLFSHEDLGAAKKALKEATTCEEVTNAYFRAIQGWMPDYAKGVGR